MPAMPGTSRGVNIWGEKGLIQRRKRQKGKGWEYAFESLPEQTQAALILRYARPEPQAEEGPSRQERFTYDPEELSRWAERRPEHLREEGSRRARLLHQVMQLVDRGTPWRQAAELVASESDCSAANLRNWYYGVNRRPGARDYRRCDWSLALIPRFHGQEPSAECDPQAWEAFKADYLRPEAPAAKACYRRLERVAAANGWVIPSLRTLERKLEREVPRLVILRARHGEQRVDRAHNSGPREREHLGALEAVNADGHRFDVRVRWPDGTIDRPWLTAWADVYSARFLGWRIGPSESSDSYRLAFYDMLREYGIPANVYVDNGRGIAAKKLTGGVPNRFKFKVKADEPLGLLTELGCNVHWTLPYRGQAKPIERAFRDLCEDIARHPKVSGAYTGNSPVTKPSNYGERVIDLDEFVRLVDQEIRAANARQGRQSRVCQGRSFDEAFFASYESRRHLIEKPTQAQLRRWMLMADRVTADKRTGAVSLLGNVYWAECMTRFVDLPQHRRKVIAAFDPDHLGEGVIVYTLDGREVGHVPAQSTRFDSTEDARRVNRERRRLHRATKEGLEAERRMNAAEYAALLDEAQPEPPATPPQDERVVRGAFSRTRKVAGSDVQPDDETQEFHQRWEEEVRSRAARELAQQLPIGPQGGDDD